MHSPGSEGLGESQLRRLEKKPSTLSICASELQWAQKTLVPPAHQTFADFKTEKSPTQTTYQIAVFRERIPYAGTAAPGHPVQAVPLPPDGGREGGQARHPPGGRSQRTQATHPAGRSPGSGTL